MAKSTNTKNKETEHAQNNVPTWDGVELFEFNDTLIVPDEPLFAWDEPKWNL